ncbi:flagellar protein FlaG [Methylobacter tundripaludum]|uniref:Flagellar protein FlaG protein n=2 Tax=Methylobacter tundripaludum TaxID=173365 RepID=G3ISY5_METTV|nr:flagellar protein FlaG [Methylobacter tundripaludum]EGW22459.1 flagellar protein FlaG protein [Methylobacter tundripaludum SV96]PPK77142.1 flagellar protein FlaG [Methylobacter tundripaludum]
MNSEITNVSKLVPATVVKNKRQNEDSASLKTDAVIDKKVESEPALSPDGLKEKEFDSNVTSLDKLKSAAVEGNSILQAANRNLEFKIDESTKKVVVKIVDNQTGETVRQIPSEDMLAFIKKMQELDGKKGSVIQSRA